MNIRKLLEQAKDIRGQHGYAIKLADDVFEEKRLSMNEALVASCPIKIGDIITVAGRGYTPNHGKKFKVELIGYYSCMSRWFNNLPDHPHVQGTLIKKDGTLGVTKLSMYLETAIDAMEKSS